MPTEMSALAKLQWLVLNGNNLEGAPPAFLGSLPALRGARLDDNQLAGPLPVAWCTNDAVYSVRSNQRLCGEWSCHALKRDKPLMLRCSLPHVQLSKRGANAASWRRPPPPKLNHRDCPSLLRVAWHRC
jgi:hypothetical protein